MVSLIGLAIGSALARRADVPSEEVPRFALLGAASPSPLLGAVLVDTALRQQDRGVEGLVARGPRRGMGDAAGADALGQLLANRQIPRARRRGRDFDEEIAQLDAARARIQEERDGAERVQRLADVDRALLDVQEAVAVREYTPDVRGAWQRFEVAVQRLADAVGAEAGAEAGAEDDLADEAEGPAADAEEVKPPR